jgi:hypothetical protein
MNIVESRGVLAEFYPQKRVGKQSQWDSTLLYQVGPASDADTATCIRADHGQSSR